MGLPVHLLCVEGLLVGFLGELLIAGLLGLEVIFLGFGVELLGFHGLLEGVLVGLLLLWRESGKVGALHGSLRVGTRLWVVLLSLCSGHICLFRGHSKTSFKESSNKASAKGTGMPNHRGIIDVVWLLFQGASCICGGFFPIIGVLAGARWRPNLTAAAGVSYGSCAVKTTQKRSINTPNKLVS